MNKNQIFKKFLQNPLIQDKIGISKTQLKKLDLHTPCEDPLIDVIKTAILHMEGIESKDLVARKINQLLKKITA